MAIDSLIFPSLPIPINYVTKRFQLRSLTIPITKASKEGNLMAKVTVRLVFTIALTIEGVDSDDVTMII